MILRGMEVDLYTLRLGGTAAGMLSDVQIHVLELEKHPGPAARERALLEMNEKLIEQMRAEPGYDLVYQRHALWSYAAMEYAQQVGAPGVLEVNAPLIQEQLKYRTLMDVPGAQEARDRAYKAARRITVVSSELAEQITPEADLQKIIVAPNGVNPERFAQMPVSTDGLLTLGFVGTLKPWHGVEVLIQAFAFAAQSVPDLKLVLIGDGPQREELEALARRFDIGDSVEFTGAVLPEEIPEHLSRVHVAVAPYPELEGFYFSPLKVLEYMAAGCGVIASDIGQIRGLIRDKENGLLVRPGSVSDLTRAILLCCDEKPLCGTLGRQARIDVTGGHTWKHVLDRTLCGLFDEPAVRPGADL